MNIQSIGILLLMWLVVYDGSGQASVEVDFAKKRYPPLVKTKFNVYQTPLASLERLKRDNARLEELNIRSLRFETAWGKSVDFNAPSITRSGGKLQYNRTDYADYVQDVVSYNVNPLLTMGYTPDPLKPSGDEWRNPPKSYSDWQEINRSYAAYWSSLGIKPITYEIWNEPDLFIFFLGNKQDYFQIYKYGSQGVKNGDPDAKVGGPVTAFDQWYSEFLGYVDYYELPIDFLSGHAYGDFEWQVNAMRRALNFKKWNGLEMYLTEYASYPTVPPDDIRPGGKQERYVAAADFFKDANRLLEYTDLTQVYWAQWSDVTFKDANGNWYLPSNVDKMGLVDYTGNPKALFNAFKIYNEMPVDRSEVTINGDGAGAMASYDLNNAGLIVWSTNEESAEVISVSCSNLPFTSGSVELYRVDEDHSSYYENRNAPELEAVENFSLAGESFSWSGEVPAKGVLYFKFADGSGQSELQVNSVASVIRTHHWFPDRSGGSYADFDHKTWITRLGMGEDRDYALAQVGIVMEDVSKVLGVQVSTDGDLKDFDENSTLAVRVDYQDESGVFTKSVLYHSGLYHEERSEVLPWGTGSTPDNVVDVSEFSDFDINIEEEAPQAFRGRIILTCIMQNTGKSSSAKMKVTKRSGEIIPVKPLIVTAFKKKELTNSNLIVFPNPTKDNITVEYLRNFSGTLDLSVWNMSGQQVYNCKMASSSLEIDTSGFGGNGVYYLTISSEGQLLQNATVIKR